MKKIIITTILASLAVSLSAQDMYDAINFSRNTYYGTARSLAMGNAMTALGGDLGSYVINPAGSAVSDYSQFAFTPGIVTSRTSASYYSDGSSITGSGSDSRARFFVPNVGVTLVMDTGNDYGVKNVSFGFQVSGTNNFQRYVNAAGPNSSTSFLGSLAAAASGMSPEDFGRSLDAGYWANQFGHFGRGENYAGSNQVIDPYESYCYVPGTINQRAVYNTYGNKTDILFNFGVNINDVLFLGANIGMPTLRYNRYECFYESSADPTQFPVHFVESETSMVTTNYLSSSNEYKYSSSASGIYAKIGVIWLPVDGVRIGAAFRTPTSMTISEDWQYLASSEYADSRFNSNAHSSLGEYSYNLRTPYSANVGAAFTFGPMGLVSIDYELEDFSSMRFRSRNVDDSSSSEWFGVNETNRLFCGLAHNLRLGGELRVLPQFALRAGYDFITSPERYYQDVSGVRITAEDYLDGNGRPRPISLGDARYFQDFTHAFSFGVGYSSDGSFYADLAVRMTSLPSKDYYPYQYGAYNALDKNGNLLNVSDPYILIKNNLWDVALTLGWRF